MTTTRREFLATAAAAARPAPAPRAWPFSLRAVRLLDPALQSMADLNSLYLHDLDADRLLHTFRLNAGLASSASPLGGWETPTVELRGHFPGHYLSACALTAASAGDEKLASKAAYMVAELARCQQKLSGGYLSAFPSSFFDRLRDTGKVWAPWYTLHKIMAGLLDLYELCGNRQALEVLQGMAAFAESWSGALTEAHMEKTLGVEHGGMVEVLYGLAAATGDQRYARTARRFYHQAVLDPLAAGRDQLKGLHVNTQIPKICGVARGYNVTGESRFRDIATYFWRQVTGHRCYSTGGTSNVERWRTEPDRLAAELSATTQECCCTYNLLKLTRQLFCWTPEAALADYYERALYNGILGTMNPADGMTMYYVPLASGYWKVFARPLASFWCCVGTGTESFASLAGGIYFHDAAGVWVNLYVASEVEWKDRGLRLRQETRFPEETAARFTIDTARPQKLALRFRVPSWAAGASVTVNGKPARGTPRPGTYFAIERAWKKGDRVEVRLPMALHAHPMPDDPTLQALMYGPLVLAGDLGVEGVTGDSQHGDPVQLVKNHFLRGDPVPAPEFAARGKALETWIRPGDKALEFSTSGQARDVRLLPLNRVVRQRYAVYWRVRS